MREAPGDQAAFCRGCDYDLRGAGAGKCPECGRAFDPSDPGTVQRRPLRARRRRLALRLLAVVGVVGGVVALAPRGYVRIDATLQDEAGAAMATSSAIALVGPRWLSTNYGVWWERADPTGTDKPPPLRNAYFAIVTTRWTWWPRVSWTNTSGGAARMDAPRTLTNGKETSGEIALRCARPVARHSTDRQQPSGMMSFEMPEDE